jgi:hypothetical protein
MGVEVGAVVRVGALVGVSVGRGVRLFIGIGIDVFDASTCTLRVAVYLSAVVVGMLEVARGDTVSAAWRLTDDTSAVFIAVVQADTIMLTRVYSTSKINRFLWLISMIHQELISKIKLLIR